MPLYLNCIFITVVKSLPTTTIILIKCVVGFPLLMIKNPLKTEYQQQSSFQSMHIFGVFLSMIVVGILFLTGFLIINSGIPTTHVTNITVVIGIL